METDGDRQNGPVTCNTHPVSRPLPIPPFFQFPHVCSFCERSHPSPHIRTPSDHFHLRSSRLFLHTNALCPGLPGLQNTSKHAVADSAPRPLPIPNMPDCVISNRKPLFARSVGANMGYWLPGLRFWPKHIRYSYYVVCWLPEKTFASKSPWNFWPFFLFTSPSHPQLANTTLFSCHYPNKRSREILQNRPFVSHLIVNLIVFCSAPRSGPRGRVGFGGRFRGGGRRVGPGWALPGPSGPSKHFETCRR